MSSRWPPPLSPGPPKLPLPGGRKGATVRVRPLMSGRLSSPPAAFHREEGRLAGLRALGLGVPRDRWVEAPVISFLVEHPGAGPMLVDTGFHPSVAMAPHEAFGRLAGFVIKDVTMEPGQAVAAQLRALGIQPAEVRNVVMTHLHSDHASGISDFPESTFVVSTAEWAAASAGGRTKGYWGRQFDHAFDWRTVDFGSQEADSFSTFGRSFDLFGDGSVRLVSTPGHTAGHLSVILRLERPRRAAHGRRRVHRAHDRRDRRALPDGGRAPLPALASRDPAVLARAPGCARDHRPRHGPVEAPGALLRVSAA